MNESGSQVSSCKSFGEGQEKKKGDKGGEKWVFLKRGAHKKL